MKGAIIGDIIGSAFINAELTDRNFQLFKPSSEFTDDTVLTLATADSILNGLNYKSTLINWVNKYPDAGYNPNFLKWVNDGGKEAYFSGGLGAARRISPIGFATESIKDAIAEATKTTEVTHNIPERIEASQATVSAIYMAKNGASMKEIKTFISEHFQYDLTLTTIHWKEEIKAGKEIKTPVPPALSAFFEAKDFEEAIRRAIFIGGPSNTIASIAGGIAQAYFKHIPKAFIRRALARLTPEMEKLISDFEAYCSIGEKSTTV